MIQTTIRSWQIVYIDSSHVLPFFVLADVLFEILPVPDPGVTESLVDRDALFFLD